MSREDESRRAVAKASEALDSADSIAARFRAIRLFMRMERQNFVLFKDAAKGVNSFARPGFMRERRRIMAAAEAIRPS